MRFGVGVFCSLGVVLVLEECRLLDLLFSINSDVEFSDWRD